MKKAFLLVVICAAIVGCGKKVNSTIGTNPNANDSLKFIINGITDITVSDGATALMGVSVSRESGEQEPVTLSITGLPNNVKAEFMNTGGTLDFATTLTFKPNAATPGSYPMTLVGTSQSGIIKTYPFKLIIEPEQPEPILGCAKGFDGKYTSNYYYTASENGTKISVDVSIFGKNALEINTLNFGPIFVELDCDNKKVLFQQQAAIDRILLSGTGTFEDNKTMYLEYTVKLFNGPAILCRDTLVKQ